MSYDQDYSRHAFMEDSPPIVGGPAGAGLPDEEHSFLQCPLGLTVMNDPVLAPDGYTYERAVIEEALRYKKESPFTRQPMDPSQLVPNRLLKELVEKWHQDRESSTAAQTAAQTARWRAEEKVETLTRQIEQLRARQSVVDEQLQAAEGHQRAVEDELRLERERNEEIEKQLEYERSKGQAISADLQLEQRKRREALQKLADEQAHREEVVKNLKVEQAELRKAADEAKAAANPEKAEFGIQAEPEDPRERMAMTTTGTDPTAFLKWQRDDAAPFCTMCRKTFSPLRRRHHCRSCGYIFCHACCASLAQIEGREGLDRVCTACTLMISQKSSGNQVIVPPSWGNYFHLGSMRHWTAGAAESLQSWCDYLAANTPTASAWAAETAATWWQTWVGGSTQNRIQDRTPQQDRRKVDDKNKKKQSTTSSMSPPHTLAEALAAVHGADYQSRSEEHEI